MGHGYGNGPGAGRTIDVGGSEGYLINSAVAVSGPLGPQQDLISLDHGVWARVAITLAIDRLILGYTGYGDRYVIIVRIGHADDLHRHQLVVWRPEGVRFCLGQVAGRGIVDVLDGNGYFSGFAVNQPIIDDEPENQGRPASCYGRRGNVLGRQYQRRIGLPQCPLPVPTCDSVVHHLDRRNWCHPA